MQCNAIRYNNNAIQIVADWKIFAAQNDTVYPIIECIRYYNNSPAIQMCHRHLLQNIMYMP